MSQLRSTTRLLLAAVLLMVGITACGDDDEAATETTPGTETAVQSEGSDGGAWQDVVAVAEQEGSLTVYTSVNPPVLAKFKDGFGKAYPGIQLEFLEATSAELIARLDQEAATGVRGADLVIFTELLWFDQRDKAGDLAAPTGPSAADWPTEYRRGDSTIVASVEPIGITVNTSLAPGGVKGYDDLLTEEYGGGKLGVTEVASSFVAAWYDFAETEYGPDFMERLAALKPAIYRGSGALAQATGSGEIVASTFGSPTPTSALIDEGAPLEYIIPEPALGTAHGIGILSSAQHANAAQVFVEFLMSDEGQTVWHGEGKTASPIKVDGALDPAEIQLWDASKYTEDKVAQITNRWNELFR